MTKIASVTLPESMSEFVDEQVASGRYASAAEVVDAGLRLLQEQERRLHVLRDALIKGEESGPATDFDFDDFIARMRAKG